MPQNKFSFLTYFCLHLYWLLYHPCTFSSTYNKFNIYLFSSKKFYPLHISINFLSNSFYYFITTKILLFCTVVEFTRRVYTSTGKERLIYTSNSTEFSYIFPYRWHKGILTSTGEKMVWETFLCHLVRKKFSAGRFYTQGSTSTGEVAMEERPYLSAELNWSDKKVCGNDTLWLLLQPRFLMNV